MLGYSVWHAAFMDQSHLLNLINAYDWLSIFDRRTLTRAADYARRGKVLDINLLGNGDQVYLLQSRVSGSSRRSYACQIRIDESSKKTRVSTTCECPVGLYCKHAAATLMMASDALTAPHAMNQDAVPYWIQQLTAQSQPSRSDPDAWAHWLAQLAVAANGQGTVAAAERCFGVLLKEQQQAGEATAQLLAQPAWLRPGKTRKTREHFVDPQALRLDPQSGPVPQPDGGWPQEVQTALATLLAPSSYAALQGWGMVNASHQEHALEVLLQHYPVWYQRGTQPLQRGPDRDLQLQWQHEANGNQRLVANMAEPGLLLHAAGLWYIHPSSGHYGRVRGDAALVKRLRYAPVLAPEDVAQISQQIEVRLGQRLPAPVQHAPPKLLRTKPLAVLHMRTLKQSSYSGGLQRIAIARIQFDYDGICLNPEYAARGVQRRLHQGQLYEIERDGAAELRALKLLDRVGAQPADELNGYPLGRTEFSPNDLILQPELQKPPLSPLDSRDTLEQLEHAGFRIEYEDDFPHFEVLEVDGWHADIRQTSGMAWFDVSLGIDVDGQRIDLLPILRRLLTDPNFPRTAEADEPANACYRVALDNARSIDLPLSRLRELIEPLLEWLETEGKLKLHRSQAPALQTLMDSTHLQWQGSHALQAQLQQLDQVARKAEAPAGFHGELRGYQQEGLAWLNFLGDAGLGGILADDMGLGKTVQVLAHILAARQRGQLTQPVLIVAPTSLISNWRDEAARFTPSLKILTLHGSDRATYFERIDAYDIVITTYPLLPRDTDILCEHAFSLLVLDEAQAIKNARSRAAQVVRKLTVQRRLAMTGTPLENHLGELWAQFDAVEPGLLGSRKQFDKSYRRPIENKADNERQQRLNRRVGSLLLRRRKDEVLTDLPGKTEITRTLEMQDSQRGLYETLRLAQHQRVREAVQERGLSQSGIVVLDALLKLRQACCDPRLVKLASARKSKGSAKLEALLELVDGLLAEDRRILVFSQFTEMLSLIEAELVQRGIDYQTLTGATPAQARGALVKRFQSGNVPIFLISLKAGGVGLNLTAADTVIHYDPWWNPAVEAQATDRAHRIGQDKPVFVYKLIMAGSVEEKIQAMQQKKAELARALLEGGASQRLRFDEEDLASLFAPL